MTLTDFLLARIAEDEATAAHARGALGWTNSTGVQIAGRDVYDPARVLGECEAKRRIVEWCGSDPGELEPGINGLADMILRDLASVYADHPDCREEWRA